MSKVFEVTHHKNRTATECGIGWPSWWPRVVQKVQVLAYEANDDQHGPDVVEGAICITSDAVWNTILGLDDPSDPLVREVDDTEANTKGREWKPQVNKILDHKKVLAICVKVGKGQSVSAQERKALDPDDEETGIGKSPLFDIVQIRSERGES